MTSRLAFDGRNRGGDPVIKHGTTTVTLNNAAQGEVAIDYGHTFTSAPAFNVTSVGGTGGYINCFTRAANRTATGATVIARQIDGAAVTATVLVDWIAVGI